MIQILKILALLYNLVCQRIFKPNWGNALALPQFYTIISGLYQLATLYVVSGIPRPILGVDVIVKYFLVFIESYEQSCSFITMT